MNIFVIFLIAISLSMDAFSLALSFGTLKLSLKVRIIVSTVVGAFHFFMPLLGALLGSWFIQKLHIESHFLEGIIFFYIAILMFKDFKNGEGTELKISIIGILLFALGVSLDSFGIGFAMSVGIRERVISSVIFSLTSAFFTLLGLNFGDKLSHWIGDYSILCGSIIMFLLALFNFCKFLFY